MKVGEVVAVDEERQLIGRAAAGDHRAFEALYRANVACVFGYLRNQVGSNVAPDLTAEVFCRAYQHLPRYEWHGVPFRAWLMRIARNLVIARARRRDTSTLPVDQIPDTPAPAADVQAIAALDSGELFAGLALLPERQRVVLELRFLQELSGAETAHVLGIGEEAIRALTYRALKALRTAVGSTAAVRVRVGS